MRIMYDSINPGSIPASATMVAGYADGRYANIPAMKARFPHATVVSIAVRWTTRAQVLDVERGDATPTDAVLWLTHTMHDVDNRDLTVYCNTSTWPTVRAAIRSASVTEPNYWVAAYDGKTAIPAGAIAKQFEGDVNGHDRSVVADYWPGVDSAPQPSGEPQWLKLLQHVMAVPEGIYEHWVPGTGWDNKTQWGIEFGEDGVPYCVIGAWDMFHECGLDAIVPRTDNVNAFADWARAHGEWTEWPSVGAWADFGNGAHCEIVIGWTADTVITKGWNSVQAGAADSGQGNGVWVHRNPRSVPTGYLAPHFPDNICPPTASPHDPRGGAAVTSYTPPEDDMTPAQAQQLADIHKAVVEASIASRIDQTMHTLGEHTAATNQATIQTHAEVAALQAALAALAKGGALTVDEITAAAKAGAAAALAQLGSVLASQKPGA